MKPSVLSLAGVPVASAAQGMSLVGVANAAKAMAEGGLTIVPINTFALGYQKIGPDEVNILFRVDPDAAETWVNPDCAKATHPDICSANVQVTDISGFTPLNSKAHYQYGTAMADVDLYSTNVSSLPDVTIGVATNSNGVDYSVFGLAPSTDPNSPSIFDLYTAAPGFPGTPVKTLSVIGGAAGESLVFNNVDLQKFFGHLQPLNMLPAAAGSDAPNSHQVTLDGITVTNEDGTQSDTAVTESSSRRIDYSTSISYLPAAIADQITKYFKAGAANADGTYTLDACPTEAAKATANFKFGEVTIRVPFTDFVVADGNACKLAISSQSTTEAGGPANSLGMTFISHIYAAWDWTSNKVWIAELKHCGEKRAAITDVKQLQDFVGECPDDTPPPPPTSTTTSAMETTTSPATTTSSMPTGSANQTTTTFTTSWSNQTTTGSPTTITEAVTVTTTYTVSSCPPVVTNCPYGKVTTEVITSYTTYCPATQDHPQPTGGNNGSGGNNGESGSGGHNGESGSGGNGSTGGNPGGNSGSNPGDNSGANPGGNSGDNNEGCTTCGSSNVRPTNTPPTVTAGAATWGIPMTGVFMALGLVAAM